MLCGAKWASLLYHRIAREAFEEPFSGTNTSLYSLICGSALAELLVVVVSFAIFMSAAKTVSSM